MSHKKPLTVKKPWGKFTQYTHNEKTTVKIIEVKNGESLSLQSHEKRDELWVALDDGLIVEISGKKTRAKKGEQFFIPRKTKHRLSATKNARILEIAFGEFDEKDITRYEDKYGRTGTNKT
ncbi:MAG: phosphomannose isomerase type II C-terminal cupin domain [archaeon]|nr:phosphomannose isomerase type II C-terminal cupin domain [archaeon]